MHPNRIKYLCSMEKNRPNIRHVEVADIERFIEKVGERSFRVKQIVEWLWKKHAHSFDEMTDLSKDLRKQLVDHFTLPALQINATQQSEDGTLKTRFRTFDDHMIEGVLIPTSERKTACVSSQVGCSLSCKFCATGTMDRKRNLTFDEIYDQVVYINQQSEAAHEKHLSNIVFMGMGEPLMNYNNVLKAIEKITSPEGLGMSPRRITVSTAGLVKQIRQLGDDGVKFNLAISLHAPNDKKRNEVMPINESNNIKSLIDAINYFYKKTGNEISFEYILFRDFNDSEKDAEELTKIYRQVPADLINVIEYNAVDHFGFDKPDEDGFEKFVGYLQKNRVNVRVRRSRGKDIDAACGQLANKA